MTRLQRTQEQWARIEVLFEELLTSDPDRRRDRLESLSGADEELRDDVTELLDAHDRAPAFLNDEAVAFAAPAIVGVEPPDSTTGPGGRLGPYELVREIGRGGMSVVYLASRADGQFEQQVAVKMFDYLSRDRDSHVRRFEEERRILASLDHPNVARVLDGGVTDGGRPYLVMEYVDGPSLADYCNRHDPGLDERLGLFLEICDAVEHAHRRLIVHRDLKPSNVLVASSEDGRTNSAKLLDFGIAKLLGPESRAVLDTRTGVYPMTPQYASPEQVRGEPISTATDVYGLGLLLYELLTGRAPYSVAGRTAADVERTICEQEPERPSLIRRDDEVPDGGAVHGFRRRLKGDLDTIALKALEKEPQRRYASASAFADDIRRFLANQPIAARSRSMAYRASKFVARHRLAVSAGVAVGLVLAIACVALLRQHALTRRERDRALVESEKARELSEFMVDLFEAGDPTVHRGREPRARDLLAAGVDRVDEISGNPSAQVEMLDAMARSYRHLGDYESARTLLERATEIQSSLNSSSFRYSQLLNHLGIVVRRLGDPDRAERLLERALEIQRTTGPEPDRAVTMANLGNLLVRKSRYEEGESLLLESLALLESVHPPSEDKIAETLSKLANLEHARGNYDAARPYAERALEAGMRALGKHPRVADYMSNLAVLRRRMNDSEGARELYESALVLLREVYGTGHPKTAATMSNYAQFLRRNGEPDRARTLWEDAIDVTVDSLGEDNRQVAQMYGNLGRLHQAEGRLDDAEPLLRRALEIRRGLWGPEHADVALSGSHLAQLLMKQGRYAEAEALFREALRVYRAVHGDAHRSTAWNAFYLGSALAAIGAFDKAEPLMLESEATMREVRGEGHRDHRIVLAGIRDFYDGSGRADLAAEWSRRLEAVSPDSD